MLALRIEVLTCYTSCMGDWYFGGLLSVGGQVVEDSKLSPRAGKLNLCPVPAGGHFFEIFRRPRSKWLSWKNKQNHLYQRFFPHKKFQGDPVPVSEFCLSVERKGTCMGSGLLSVTVRGYQFHFATPLQAFGVQSSDSERLMGKVSSVCCLVLAPIKAAMKPQQKTPAQMRKREREPELLWVKVCVWSGCLWEKGVCF